MGDILNTATLKMVDSAIAAITYLVFMFMYSSIYTQTSPLTVFKNKLWEMIIILRKTMGHNVLL